MHANKILVCLTILFLSIELIVGEPKRSFGFGRSRPKSNSNLSVRRRGHLSDPPKAPQPKQTHQPQAPSAPVAPPVSAPKINGPPPAYSAGPSSGKTSLNAAPPAYTAHAAPPSYSSATGLHSNYPRQGMAPAYGGSPYGHQAPGWNYGGAGAHPSGGYGGYGGGAMPSYGGYGGHGGMMGGGMPNYGGGMMGGGMMGGGMMGGGMMGGGMQPVYVKQRSSGSLLPSIAGGALTGLAVYQLTRSLSGGGHGGYGGGGYGGSHDSTQHIYHHYDSPQGSGQISDPNQNQPAQQTPQLSHAPEQTLHTSGQSTHTSTYGSGVQQLPDVPLAPFPPEANVNAEKCTENCSTETENVAVTPVPEIDHEFPFSTIHPSLFPYASPLQNKELDFWARSINKKLDLNAPDTDNSATTASPSKKK